MSENEVSCTTPPPEPAVTTLSVSINGRDYVPTEHGFTYVVPPRVHELAPVGGVAEGGTLVRIDGSSFGVFGFSPQGRLVPAPSRFPVTPSFRHPAK